MSLTYTADRHTADDIITWTFSVAYAEYDHEQSRHAFAWTIARNDIVLSTSVTDWDSHIRTGVRGEYDHPGSLSDVLATLFSFLSAWSYAMNYSERTGTDSENVDLFDSRLVPLLDAFSGDELALFGDEVKGDR